MLYYAVFQLSAFGTIFVQFPIIFYTTTAGKIALAGLEEHVKSMITLQGYSLDKLEVIEFGQIIFEDHHRAMDLVPIREIELVDHSTGQISKENALTDHEFEEMFGLMSEKKVAAYLSNGSIDYIFSWKLVQAKLINPDVLVESTNPNFRVLIDRMTEYQNDPEGNAL